LICCWESKFFETGAEGAHAGFSLLGFRFGAHAGFSLLGVRFHPQDKKLRI
jgi:hypothetical protein